MRGNILKRLCLLLWSALLLLGTACGQDDASFRPDPEKGYLVSWYTEELRILNSLKLQELIRDYDWVLTVELCEMGELQSDPLSLPGESWTRSFRDMTCRIMAAFPEDLSARYLQFQTPYQYTNSADDRVLNTLWRKNWIEHANYKSGDFFTIFGRDTSPEPFSGQPGDSLFVVVDKYNHLNYCNTILFFSDEP